MANSNFTKRLTKELRRSPKKSAMLALLGVVALWFWAPLAWKWIAPQNSDAALSTTEPEANSTPSSDATSGVATPTTSASTEPILSWRALANLQNNEPLMSTARQHEKLADPFAQPIIEAQATTNEESEQENKLETAAVLAAPTPEQLGLTLSSTIIGGGMQVATINGRPCRIGAVLVVPSGGYEYEFTITNIQASEATLTAGSETYVLTSRRPDNKMQLSPAGTANSSMTPAGSQRIVIGATFGE